MSACPESHAHVVRSVSQRVEHWAQEGPCGVRVRGQRVCVRGQHVCMRGQRVCVSLACVCAGDSVRSGQRVCMRDSVCVRGSPLVCATVHGQRVCGDSVCVRGSLVCARWDSVCAGEHV